MRLGFLTNSAETKKQGVFEKAEPALDASLSLIGAYHLRIADVAGWTIGAKNTAGTLLLVGRKDLLSGADLGVYMSRNRLEGTRGGRPPFAGIAFVVDHLAGVKLMRAPRVGQRRQCGVCRLRRLKTFDMQVEPLLLDGGPFTLLRVPWRPGTIPPASVGPCHSDTTLYGHSGSSRPDAATA
jgi:hypothetical protein